MDGGTGVGAVTVFLAVVGVAGRLIIRVDRHERFAARRPHPPRLVPRSPLLAERRPEPEPQDARPPLVEVPDRLLVRAARIVAGEHRASAGLLQRRLPVIEPMAVKLMAALEGRGVIGPQDEVGEALVLVSPRQLPELFEQWGVVEDA